MDSTNATLKTSNDEVDELCGCTGKEKTRSRRVLKEFHESWCFYHQHLEDQFKEALEKWKDKHNG